jgi:glycine/serine hydroxymethyltransferase
MSLPHGGHLTHGTKVSFSGKWFNAVHYGVAQGTEDIDYDQMRDLAREHRPKMIIAGGSAIPRLIDFAAFREVADEVGAVFMVDARHFIGLVAGRRSRARCRTPTSSPSRPTRCCAARAAAPSSARPSTPPSSTRPSSR